MQNGKSGNAGNSLQCIAEGDQIALIQSMQGNVCTHEGMSRVLLKPRYTPASAPPLPHSARHLLTEGNDVAQA